MYNITAIRRAYDPIKYKKLRFSWETFTRFITMTRTDGHQDKKEVPVWSPASFAKYPLKNENVLFVSFAVFDIDGGLEWDKHHLFDAYQYVAHTSYSHTYDKHKWRLIIPFETPIPNELWSTAWKRLSKWFEDITGMKPDKACKDSRRFYYLPSGAKSYDDGVVRGFYRYEGKLQRVLTHINNNGRNIAYDLDELYQEKKRMEEANKRWIEKKRRELEALRNKPEYLRNPQRELRLSLLVDRTWRETLGLRLGGKITHDRAIKFPCPGCGKSDATYFYLDPIVVVNVNDKGEQYESCVNFKAYCQHLNHCGLSWDLFELGKQSGAC